MSRRRRRRPSRPAAAAASSRPPPPRPRRRRSFLTGVEDDSIDGIFDAVTKCAKISKYGGGIGLHVTGVRGKGAPIRGTNGRSDGLVPMLRVLNSVAGYVNQVRRRVAGRRRTRGTRPRANCAAEVPVRGCMRAFCAPRTSWVTRARI